MGDVAAVVCAVWVVLAVPAGGGGWAAAAAVLGARSRARPGGAGGGPACWWCHSRTMARRPPSPRPGPLPLVSIFHTCRTAPTAASLDALSRRLRLPSWPWLAAQRQNNMNVSDQDGAPWHNCSKPGRLCCTWEQVRRGPNSRTFETCPAWLEVTCPESAQAHSCRQPCPFTEAHCSCASRS